MQWRNRDVREEPPRSAFVGSVLVHAVVGVVAVALTLARPEPLEFVTYEIEIVSPPPAYSEEIQEPAPVEELEIETPDEPDLEPEEMPIPDIDPEPTPPPPDPEPTPPDSVPPDSIPPDSIPTETTAPEEPEEQPEETGEDIEVRMEGLRRDFPAYYDNIIRQIERCWRPPRNAPAGLRATVYFVIRPDGTVTDVRMVERSGSVLFDGLAQEAIGGCATGRFGALPEDLSYERLPIQFEFRPSGQHPIAPTSTSTPAPA